MKKTLTIYRVRRSAYDIKSQKGAYILLEAAIKKAKQSKCNVYDNNLKCIFKYGGN
ncbi:MAG: hypothetical protein IKT38_05110 [Clostridia bacterium]|nr:hypothetical protein [Clostridia bacterium]